MLHAMHMYLFSVVLYSRLFCVWLCGGNGWVVLYVVHISILCGKMGIVTQYTTMYSQCLQHMSIYTGIVLYMQYTCTHCVWCSSSSCHLLITKTVHSAWPIELSAQVPAEGHRAWSAGGSPLAKGSSSACCSWDNSSGCALLSGSLAVLIHRGAVLQYIIPFVCIGKRVVLLQWTCGHNACCSTVVLSGRTCGTSSCMTMTLQQWRDLAGRRT